MCVCVGGGGGGGGDNNVSIPTFTPEEEDYSGHL